MNEADLVLRDDPHLVCNNCKAEFHPYPMRHAPTIDEVVCPKCGTKRILYYGEDTSVVKMILTTYGVNKELTERLDRLENQIGSLKDTVKTSLDDARNVMTKALIGALNEQINQHVKDWHNIGGIDGTPES
jgi:DNA-directed RNA polymerase subunit RPC12/RpoP